VKYWEIIADNLSKAGFSWGCSSEIDFNWPGLERVTGIASGKKMRVMVV